MTDKETVKIKKATVLSVKDLGTFQGDKGPVQMWEIVVQNAEDLAKVYTGVAFRKDLPSGVNKEGVSSIENVDVVIEKKGDSTKTKIYFADQGTGSGGGFKGGYSAPKEDPILKLVSFAYSYSKDLYLDSKVEAFNLEGYLDMSSQVLAAMVTDYKLHKL